MVVKTEIGRFEMSPDSFGMTSLARDRILLPYSGGAWDDLLLAAEGEVMGALPVGSAEDAPFETLVRSLRISMLFNIQRSQVRTTAYCLLDSPVADSIEFRSLSQMTDQSIQSVLEQFFSCGASGLEPEYRTYYKNVYEKWRCVA